MDTVIPVRNLLERIVLQAKAIISHERIRKITNPEPQLLQEVDKR
jgi:hypothetical protein